MTDKVWPAGIPQVLQLEGLSAQRQGNIIRTDMDAGPAKQRRRYTASTKQFSGKITVNETERATLEKWYREEIADGALRFVMINPQTLAPAEFRFLEGYSEESNGDGLTNITMTLEQMS